MSPKSASMRYAHIFCGSSKRPKPNESRRFHPQCLVVLCGERLTVARTQALLDEAEIGRESLDFGGAQRAGSQRHRRPWSRMISLAPFFEPALQVEIGHSSETRYLAHALASRAMAGEACDDIGFRNSLQVNRLSSFRERPMSIMGGFRRQRRKIVRQNSHRVGIQIRCGPPHVL